MSLYDRLTLSEALDPSVKKARAFVRKERGNSSRTAKAKKKILEASALLASVSADARPLARAVNGKDERELWKQVSDFDHRGNAIHAIKHDVLSFLDLALEGTRLPWR